MANIRLTGVFSQKSREFSTQGSGLERFEQDFVDAVNYACKRISLEANLETAISEVTSIQDTLGLDDAYTHILSDGITLYLMDFGQRPAKGAEANRTAIENRFVQGISLIYQAVKNSAQEGDGYEDTDVIGLGALA